MERAVFVYTTYPSLVEAEKAGRAIVERRLAACVNILGPCHSIYRWQDKIEEAVEVPVIFKTGADAAHALVARLAELHSYDVPAAVVWPIADAVPAYAQWVREEIGR